WRTQDQGLAGSCHASTVRIGAAASAVAAPFAAEWGLSGAMIAGIRGTACDNNQHSGRDNDLVGQQVGLYDCFVCSFANNETCKARGEWPEMLDGRAVVRSRNLLYTDEVGRDACGIGGVAAREGKP